MYNMNIAKDTQRNIFTALLFGFALYGVIVFCKAISNAFKIKKSSEVVNVEDVKDKED